MCDVSPCSVTRRDLLRPANPTDLPDRLDLLDLYKIRS